MLSYGISFTLDCAGTKKLLRVEVDNLDYFLGPNSLSGFYLLTS